MKIGERISDIRQSRGLSVQDLAKLIDVRPQFVANIEDGTQKAHTLTYRKIADALNVPLEMLLDQNYVPPTPEKWQDELPGPYRWLIVWIIRLVIILGALWLILATIITASSILLYWLHFDDSKFDVWEKPLKHLSLEVK